MRVTTLVSLLLIFAGASGCSRNDAPSPAGGCGDLQSDPKHCGACDHDCRGTACTDGVCAPVVLAERLDFPNEIAVDDTHVYVSDGGGIHRVPVAGGALEPCAAGVRDPKGLAIDDRDIFTSGDGPGRTRSLVAVPKGGGPVRVVAASVDAYRIAVDATDVFASIGGILGGKGPADGRIVRVPRSGGAPVEIASGLWFLTELTLSGDDVFFVENGAHRIARVPKAGGAVSTVAQLDPNVHALAVGAGHVVWIDTQVRHATPSGGDLRALHFTGGNDVAVDGAYAYWATPSADGWVWRAPLAGGPALHIAPSPNRVEAIAVHGGHVYWAERGVLAGGLLESRSARVLRAGR